MGDKTVTPLNESLVLTDPEQDSLEKKRPSSTLNETQNLPTVTPPTKEQSTLKKDRANSYTDTKQQASHMSKQKLFTNNANKFVKILVKQ